MSPVLIFALQATASTIAFAAIAGLYLWPRLVRLPMASALVALLWIHTFRTLGATLLVPSIIDPRFPGDFAFAIAVGDLIAAGLAFLSILALRARWVLAIPLVWIFNVEGTLDLLNAIYSGIANDITRYDLGPAWFIPTYFVPALLVTHAMIFVLLLRRAEAPGLAR